MKTLRVIAVLGLLWFLFGTLSLLLADEDIGFIEFLDKKHEALSSIQVYHIETEDLNRYVKYLDDTAFVVGDLSLEPTFYVQSIPDDAMYLRWTRNGYDTDWVIIRDVQTDLPAKAYVPAVQEVGLMRDDNYHCNRSLLCTAARNGW